jgi:hypothetical protein
MAEQDYDLKGPQVERFLTHLDEWGASLDRPDRALLQIVLERAAASSDKSFEDFAFTVGPGTASEIVAPFLHEIVTSTGLTIRARETPDRETPDAIRQGGAGWSEWGRG